VNSRRLWSPKDEQAWVHDRFDEMDLHDFHGDNVSFMFSYFVLSKIHWAYLNLSSGVI
jgi:hypothetical protein